MGAGARVADSRRARVPRDPRVAVMDDDVPGFVEIVREEVRREGLEADVAAVGRDGRRARAFVRLAAVAGEAHAFGQSGLPIVYEDVEVSVRVPGDQVRCEALEGDDATIGGHRSAPRAVVALAAIGRHADA